VSGFKKTLRVLESANEEPREQRKATPTMYQP
jgi:hypothetical protein